MQLTHLSLLASIAAAAPQLVNTDLTASGDGVIHTGDMPAPQAWGSVSEPKVEIHGNMVSEEKLMSELDADQKAVVEKLKENHGGVAILGGSGQVNGAPMPTVTPHYLPPTSTPTTFVKAAKSTPTPTPRRIAVHGSKSTGRVILPHFPSSETGPTPTAIPPPIVKKPHTYGSLKSAVRDFEAEAWKDVKSAAGKVKTSVKATAGSVINAFQMMMHKIGLGKKEQA